MFRKQRLLNQPTLLFTGIKWSTIHLVSSTESPSKSSSKIKVPEQTALPSICVVVEVSQLLPFIKPRTETFLTTKKINLKNLFTFYGILLIVTSITEISMLNKNPKVDRVSNFQIQIRLLVNPFSSFRTFNFAIEFSRFSGC